MAKNIYITGFMGAGKTRTGLLLAQKLGRRFHDTDQEIERQTRLTIAEIFAKHGEGFFRELEADTIQDIAQKTGLVVSLGGGAVLAARTRDLISRGIWVFINTPLEIIKERVMRKSHRPLAQDVEKLEALYQQRLPIYQLAPLSIEGTADAESICQSIIQRMIDEDD